MESRKLSVIMFTDMVGYSRKVQENEARALDMLTEHNAIIGSLIEAHHGHTIKTIGDAFLADFDSVFSAVNCAVDIQKKLAGRNVSVEAERRIEVRIGIHVGDVIYRDRDVFGDGVNIASRIQSIAGPGAIYISHDIYSIALGKLTYQFKDLGVRELKNISRPIHVYEVLWDPARAHEAGEKPFSRRSRISIRTAAWTVVIVILILAAARMFLTSPSPATASARPILAIVGFSDLTGDENLRRVQLGKIINDAMIQKFYEFPYIQLASPLRLSRIVRELNIRDQDIPLDLAEKIAREADGRLMITGNIKKVGQTFILSADLNDLNDEKLLATFVVKNDMEESILGPLIDSLSAKFQHKIVETFDVRDTMPRRYLGIGDLTTRSLEAYDHFIRGFELHEYGELDSATAEFTRAIALDSNFALAYSLVACSYSFNKQDDKIPPLFMERLHQFRGRFDGLSKEALIFRGNMGWVDNQPEECGRNYGLLSELYPDDREAHYYYALYLHYLKHDYAAAITTYERCLQLSPDYFPIIRDLAYATKESRGVDAAVHVLQNFLQTYPGNPGVPYARKQIAELRGVR